MQYNGWLGGLSGLHFSGLTFGSGGGGSVGGGSVRGGGSGVFVGAGTVSVAPGSGVADGSCVPSDELVGPGGPEVSSFGVRVGVRV